MLLDGGTYNGVRIVADSTVALFTKRAAGHRALGWDTCDGGAGCGQHLSERAYGHTGFTGTSLWIDPDRQVFVILLTNRVYAARARRPSKVIADVRNDLADAAVLAVMDDPGGVLAMPASFRADVAADWNRPLRSSRARSSVAARRRLAAAKAAAARRASASKGKGSAAKSSSAKGSSVKRPPASAKPTAAKTSSKSKAVKPASTTVKKPTSTGNKTPTKRVSNKKPAR